MWRVKRPRSSGSEGSTGSFESIGSGGCLGSTGGVGTSGTPDTSKTPSTPDTLKTPRIPLIRVTSLLEGAQQARGVAVIVDVFRAFTTAAVALEQGAKKIIFVAKPEDALRLREKGFADLCVGEVGGIPPPGFDFGNSPYELANAHIYGKVIAHSTRAGTVGITAAAHCSSIYGASLINARATVDAILAEKPEEVTIVAMGLAGKVRTDEDEQCALYLRNLLEGRDPDPEAVRNLILASGEVSKFMDPDRPYLYPEDIDYALRVNAIAIPVRVRREEGMLVAG